LGALIFAVHFFALLCFALLCCAFLCAKQAQKKRRTIGKWELCARDCVSCVRAAETTRTSEKKNGARPRMAPKLPPTTVCGPKLEKTGNKVQQTVARRTLCTLCPLFPLCPMEQLHSSAHNWPVMNIGELKMTSHKQQIGPFPSGHFGRRDMILIIRRRKRPKEALVLS